MTAIPGSSFRPGVTIQKALRILKGEGLVTSVADYGTFVADK